MKSAAAYFEDDPFARYYNLDGLTDVFLTGDVDWAPDFAIEQVLRTVEAHGHKLTLFATHKSATLASPPDWLEVGLHPDFTRKTGPWLDERFTALKALYPQAVGMRSHRNFFGQNVADLAHAHGMRYDASNILFNQSLAQAHVDYNGMTRFTYTWEDGIHLDMKFGLDFNKINLHTPGMKILNVHPILIYLNSSSDDHRRSVTRRYPDLTNAPQSEIAAEVNKGRGIGDVWREMLQLLSEKGVRTHLLRDAAA